MKAETIAALAEKLTSAFKQDEVLRKVRARAKSKKIEKAHSPHKGPHVTVAELARLVDMRLRQRKIPAKELANVMVEEIEATLDLVEACEVMLANRQEQWQKTVWELQKAILNDEDHVSEIVKGIRVATYPMKFETGLIRMGIPERGREEKYWRFFKDFYVRMAFYDAPEGQSFSEFLASRPCIDDETRQALAHRKAEGWRNASYLEVVEGQWRRWWAKHKHDGQKTGGIRSVKARAKKKAKVKVLPAHQVKR